MPRGIPGSGTTTTPRARSGTQVTAGRGIFMGTRAGHQWYGLPLPSGRLDYLIAGDSGFTQVKTMDQMAAITDDFLTGNVVPIAVAASAVVPSSWTLPAATAAHTIAQTAGAVAPTARAGSNGTARKRVRSRTGARATPVAQQAVPA